MVMTHTTLVQIEEEEEEEEEIDFVPPRRCLLTD